MTEDRGVRVRYFLISFSATFFLMSLLLLFLMTTVHPKPAVYLGEEVPLSEEEAYLPSPEDALTVLFFGSETPEAEAGTFLLARFDPVRGGVSIAVFPPQTLLHANGREETLAEAYRYGGARYTQEALSAYLEVPIDRYVRLHLSGFITAAAAIGTVEFDLEEELVLTDGELSVTLLPGRQLLDGRKVAAIIRQREDGESVRCRRTAELACAVVNQRIDVADSVLVDRVFETVINLVDTDISYADFEQRKAAAQAMARQEGEIASFLPVEGAFSSEGEALALYDTTLTILRRRFL